MKLVTTSTSSNAIDKLLKQSEYHSLSSEFQSLPPNILFGNAKQANEIEQDLLNDSLKQKSESQTIQDLVKTTVTSLIETTVKTSIEEMTKEVQQEKEKNLASKLMPSLFVSSNAVSSSSPNPACSPFKFLDKDANLPKSPSHEIKLVSTLSPNGSTIQDAVSVFNAEQSKLSNSVIEKLAQLNHRDHEKEDPILNSSAKITPGITPSNSQIINEQTTSSMTVPASSQEFCMNLNLNLAAVAANNSNSPVVVGESQKETLSEHQRFTSNASTSSIHNDLKMILEGTKSTESSPTAESKKSDQQKQSPKPQREKHNRSKTEKKEKSNNKSDTKLDKSSDDLMKLVNMMKQMSENKGKPGQQIGGDETGKYRYTRDFLQQIRSERSAFIDNINPEIFKAYCYCMSGKYWDPEKYFDIIQYSGDYERVVQQQSQQPNKITTKKPVTKTDKKPKVIKNSKNDANNNIKENILGSLGLTKTGDGKQADKILLDLLKKDQKKPEEPKQVNLIDMLNKKQKSSNILGELFNQNQSAQTGPVKHGPVILTAQELELSQINRPVNRLFTALNQTPDLASKLKSPNSCGSNSCVSECSSASSDMANNTEAYKQLIKNLSNHPLCTPSATRGSNFDNVLMKLQPKKSETEQVQSVAKDGTNLLKQLLNLKPEQEHEKKQKNKRNHHHQHRNQKLSKSEDSKVFTSVESTVTTTTTTTITQTQFPTVNPHEKPFQNLKQVEKPTNQLENLFNKMKVQTPEPQQQQPKAPKVEQKTEKDHFNSLLNKIMPTSQPKQSEVKKESESILKWFAGMNLNSSQQQS